MSNQPYMARGTLPGFGTLLWLQDRAEQANRLEAEVETLRGDNELMRTFIRKFISGVCWNIDGGDVQGTAEEMGLLKPVAYDPDIHGEVDYAEPGDTIYTFAGPLIRKEDTNA